MTTIYQYNVCSTSGARGLDLQLIHQIQRIAPGALVRFDHLPVKLGAGCHPYLQPVAVKALELAIRDRSSRIMTINSAYRTLAQQAILHTQCQRKRCGILAAAQPGLSNHNSGLSIDVEDAPGWKRHLEHHGWDWIGSFDPMHFDYKAGGAKDLRFVSIKAFQQLWNLNNPKSKIAEDGKLGSQTHSALMGTSVNGFRNAPGEPIEDGIPIPKLAPTFKPSLCFGMTGAEVMELQRALTSKGFKVDDDGVYGDATQKAVRAYQAKAGIMVDGVVGMGTRSRLGLT